VTRALALGESHRRAHVASALGDLGYHDRLVWAEFPVFTSAGISRCDYVAFGEESPRDMTTATLVADVVSADERPDGLVARALATPFRLAAAPSSLEVWQVSSDGQKDEIIRRLDYGPDGVEWPGRLMAALGPDQLLSAKRGSRQLSLLDIDVSLLPRARGQVAATLAERVEDALAEMLSLRAGRQRLDLAVAAQLVVGALTALMVRDKAEASAGAVSRGALQRAVTTFPEHFAWVDALSEFEHSAVEGLIEALGADVNYASLDPAVVSNVYEEAVVSKLARKALGVHYTPSDLARRIAAALPFEKLDPDARSVLDLACGSGTLLLAAHDRLRALAPPRLDAAERHEYVRSHLTGFDVDEFAVQIAQLSLLLHALPEGDGWRVEPRDALADHTQTDRELFSVVMTNPPWRQRRSVGGRRHERADDFVMAALRRLAPGGLLALILPATWLDSDASQAARAELTKQADVFEIWRLPEQTFGSASLAPCVIFAERGTSKHGRTLFRRVLARGQWRERFFLDGRADEQHLAPAPVDGRGFLSGPIARGTGLAVEGVSLDDLAIIQQGPVPEPPIEQVGALGGNHRWLREAEDLPSYCEPDERAIITVRYPEDFHRRIRDPSLFDAPKLLVSAKRATNNPWRVKVGYDLHSLIPRETLYMVIPRERDDTELLWGMFAVMSSSIASCWVDTYSPTLSIPRRVITSLPFPSADATRALSDSGRALAHAARQDRIDSETVLALEKAVWDAYELDDVVRARVQAQLAGFRAPEGRVRFDLDEEDVRLNSAAWSTGPSRRVGATLDSHELRGVKLWIPGITDPDGEWHDVPHRFFGWLATPDATFNVRIRAKDVHNATFSFQKKSFRTAEDILSTLSANGGEGDD
jgi:SAM-dependent methyltransferase